MDIRTINRTFLKEANLRASEKSVPGTTVITGSIDGLGQVKVDRLMIHLLDPEKHKSDEDLEMGTIRDPSISNRTILWKIDYYSSNLESGSEDPCDLQKTHRVLTLMFADES